MASCATKITPPAHIPTAPAKVESAKPIIKKTQDSIDKGVVENAKIQEKVSEQKNTALEQELLIKDALIEAEKIKEKAAAKEILNEIEAANLVNILEKAEEKSAEMKNRIVDLEKTVKDQGDLLKNAQSSNRDVSDVVGRKETEADVLRDQNKDMGNSLEVKNKEVTDLTKDKIKDAKKIGSASVYKHWVIGGVSLLILGVIFTYLVKAGIIFAKAKPF